MRIVRIAINNYKSIGEEKNILYPEKGVSVIIGKNESGKSNLLDCLNTLNFRTVNRLNAHKNKMNNKNPLIEVTVEFSDTELSGFHHDFDKKSVFIFEEGKLPQIQGGLADFIAEKIKPIQEYFRAFIQGLSNISNDTKKNLTAFFGSDFDTNISRQTQNISSTRSLLSSAQIDATIKNEASTQLDTYEQYVLHLDAILPIFFKFDEKDFAASYTIDEINKNANNKSIINSFFKSAGIDLNSIVKACSSSDGGEKQFYQEEIEQKLELLSESFSQFYQKEKVYIKINFETNRFHLLIATTRRSLYITERSNGLRWYLNLYIQLKEQNLLDKNVVLLLDEPGVYLHIDAQAKLVELLNDFGTKNQILYTTHSPFMIDSTYLSNIRLVCNENGFTSIFNSVSDLKVPESSKEEVLSPLCKALGFSAKYNIGPSYDKQNIIVEGITDYYYLKGVMHLLGIAPQKQPYIIPSIGVSNINQIASILLGWGCDFKILTDFDEAAYREYERLTCIGLESGKEVFNVATKEFDLTSMISSPMVIEDIFSSDDKVKFNCGQKTLTAKRFLELSMDKEINLEDKSLGKIKSILFALNIIK